MTFELRDFISQSLVLSFQFLILLVDILNLPYEDESIFLDFGGRALPAWDLDPGANLTS